MTFKRLGRRLLIFLAILALMAGAAFWGLLHAGRWLVTPDPLQHAQAIVVLSGKAPFRALEAADLYRQGWAPQVWLLRDEPDDAAEAFAKLGIVRPTELDYDQKILALRGVPKDAIRILEPPTTNTQSEVKLIASELRRQGADAVIVVTSPVHTRRSKLIWRLVAGDHPQAILRFASSEPSDPDHWWRTTHDIQDVGHEFLGLIDARLGFIANPKSR